MRQEVKDPHPSKIPLCGEGRGFTIEVNILEALNCTD
jgi:hypothetical protein